MRRLPLLCSALALGWLSTAAAQPVLPSEQEPAETGGTPEDIPDNMAEFRSTPLTDPADAAEAWDGAEAVEGKVVALSEEQVWVESAGQLHALEVTEQTQLEPGRAQVLREGAEVRAHFSPEQEVTRIEAVAEPPAE